MPWGDAGHDAAAHDLIGQFPGAPLADRAVGVGRNLAGQRDDLADLFGRDPRRTAGLGRIRQAFGHAPFGQWGPRTGAPARPPLAGGIYIQVESARNLLGAQPFGRQKHDAGAHRQLLPARARPHQALELGPLLFGQYDLGGLRTRQVCYLAS